MVDIGDFYVASFMVDCVNDINKMYILVYCADIDLKAEIEAWVAAKSAAKGGSSS